MTLTAPSIVSLALLLLVLIGAVVALLVQRGRHARAQRALRASEERFRHTIDRAPVIIWMARPDTTLDYANTTCTEFLGVPMAQVLGNGWLEAVHLDDVNHCLGTYMPAFEARAPFVMEYRVRRADGEYRWVLDSGVPKYAQDGSFSGYVGCTVDITERKGAEEALESSHREVRQLAGRLLGAQDAERARIARDLHDDISQQIAALGITLSALKRRVEALPIANGLTSDVSRLQQRIGALGNSVRHLSHELHPGMLRHAGLEAALSALCEELEQHHTLRLTCQTQGSFESLDAQIALCLYRVAQEALRNVVSHAEARQASVQLVRAGELAELCVIDDGKGFDVGSARQKQGGMGLISIGERARLVGGTLSVVTELNKGTRVRVQVPVRVPTQN